jgi:hypothetical protein
MAKTPKRTTTKIVTPKKTTTKKVVKKSRKLSKKDRGTGDGGPRNK